MSSPSLFFKQETNFPLKAVFTNVGDNFLALPTAIADRDLMTVTKARELISGQLLERHLHYFPSYTKALSNSSRQFLRPLSGFDLIKFIHDFAYTLKQIIVDELCPNFRLYPESSKVAPEVLRADLVELNSEIIEALARKLRLKVVIHNHPLRKFPFTSFHGPKNSQAMLTLSCVDNYYSPKLYYAEKFKLLENQEEYNLAIENAHVSTDPIVDDIQAHREKACERLREKYESKYKELMTLVRKQKLSEVELRTAYKKNLEKKDRTLSVSYPGTESGTQLYFEELLALKKLSCRALPLNEENKHSILEDLVAAIAAAISLGQMDEKLISQSHRAYLSSGVGIAI